MTNQPFDFIEAEERSFNFFSCRMEDDEEDEEEELEDVFMMMVLSSVPLYNTARRPTFRVRDRLEWDYHVAQLQAEGRASFYKLYRMDHQAFVKLCSLVDPFVKVDPVMLRIRTRKGPIITEIALHCLLRWLGGGAYLDIRLSAAGISPSFFYKCVHKCVEAILRCEELKYSFPSTEKEMDDAAEAFRACSSHGVIDGCVGCVDGILIKVQVPGNKETAGHVKSFFSGHYQYYGVNVQASCDARCRFNFMAVAAPGGANDIAAFRKTRLHKRIMTLPLGKYIIGDNAYACGEKLLTPFSGDEKKDIWKDAYNFFLSQIRIRIEMSFGRFVNKWRIFKQPLQVKLKNVGRIVLCASRLHNFCINEGVANLDARNTNVNPMGKDQEEEPSFLPSDVNDMDIPGHSTMRNFIVEDITERGLTRPRYNVRRNRNRGY